MTSLKVRPGSLPRRVGLPGSKSYANRILILAAIGTKAFEIRDLPESSDVIGLLNGLQKAGIVYSRLGRDLKIMNSFPACEKDGAEIEVGEGGTTARFLATMLLLGEKRYTLILGQRLKKRPWEEFIEFVKNHGGRAELIDSKLQLQGPLHLPKQIEIDCSRTTQFASGLSLAYSGQGIKVVPVRLASSQSYWEMTEELIEKIKGINHFDIPLDWSSASYSLAYGALNHSIFFPDLYDDSFQSDSKFLHLLKGFAAIEANDKGITVHPIKVHREVKLDVSDCLDLVPALSFFLAHVKGKHKLSGVKNLVFKESDRLNEVTSLLSLFGRKAVIEDDILIIYGDTSKNSLAIDLQLPDDHRMVMAGSLFLRHHQGGSVAPAEAVRKSYPNFFELFS
jgi:3-phosphoshikimate 1-carboxyvinyltransferase